MDAKKPDAYGSSPWETPAAADPPPGPQETIPRRPEGIVLPQGGDTAQSSSSFLTPMALEK